MRHPNLKQPVDVLYLLEHPSRELDIACAITQVLKKKYNLKVEIASLSFDLWKTIQTFEPRLIISPFFYSAKDHAIYDLKYHYPGVPFLALNFEQAISQSEATYFCPKDEFARNHVWHLAWAESYRQLLISKGVRSEKILLAGNPHLALLMPPYIGTIPPRAELARRFGLDIGKKWIFFPLNYTWAFLTADQLQGRIDRGYNADRAHRYRDFLVKSLEASADWWLEASKLKDVELIIRPKPNAPKEEFLKFIERRWGEIPSSVHIIQDLRLTDWVGAIDMAFTSFSTSIFQTLLMDKPGWLMEPITFPEFFRCDVNEIVPSLKTKEEFIDVLTHQCHWNSQMEAVKKEILNRWIPEGDPIQVIARLIHERVHEIQMMPLEPRLSLRDIMDYKINRAAVKLKKLIKPASGVPLNWKNHYFSSYDVTRTLEKWDPLIDQERG